MTPRWAKACHSRTRTKTISRSDGSSGCAAAYGHSARTPRRSWTMGAAQALAPHSLLIFSEPVLLWEPILRQRPWRSLIEITGRTAPSSYHSISISQMTLGFGVLQRRVSPYPACRARRSRELHLSIDTSGRLLRLLGKQPVESRNSIRHESDSVRQICNHAICAGGAGTVAIRRL